MESIVSLLLCLQRLLSFNVRPRVPALTVLRLELSVYKSDVPNG